MFITKTRTALAVTGATLGVVVAAVPAQAATSAPPPTRPPALRLQGAATTVTVFWPAGTRNVYLRAASIRRTSTGAVMRTITGTPIKLIRTRIIIQDGKVVARVSAGATGQGASEATCDRMADAINSWNDVGIPAALNSGNADAVNTAVNTVAALENKALDAGCVLVY